MALTPKQRSFVEFYLQSWNAREAAEKAGYAVSSATKMGWRLLNHPEVKVLVNERLKELGVSAAEVVVRLSKQARANYGDFFIVDKHGVPSLDWTMVVQNGDLVKRITYTRQGKPVLELYDAQRALELLGKYAKLESGQALIGTDEDSKQGHDDLMNALREWKNAHP